MKKFSTLTSLAIGIALSHLPCAQCYVRGARHASPLRQPGETAHRRRLATAPVDVLFIVDESDSMSEEQNDVRERVKEIFDQLPPGSAVGLVGYGRRSSIFAPRPGAPQVHTPLTTDSDKFQAAADDLQATGTYEPAYLALYQSVADDFSVPLGFRGNKFCSILITDESSNGSGVTQTQTIDALQGGTDSGLESAFFGITVDGNVRRSYERIAASTGGAMFRLEDFRRDPSFVLTPVLEACTVAVLDNILLDPAMDTKIVGQSHTVAASVLKIVDESVIDVGVISDGIFDPQEGVPVTFEVVSGPNVGVTGFCTADSGCTTDDAGELSFTYVGDGGVGVDEIEACFTDSLLGTNKCTTVLAEWMNNPTTAPSSGPTFEPSLQPSAAPMAAPTKTPSSSPSMRPTLAPSMNPTLEPSRNPTLSPSVLPSFAPSVAPSPPPSTHPSTKPTLVPTMSPTTDPSSKPSSTPSISPSSQPPTSSPSAMPTSEPSLEPTSKPTTAPSAGPSSVPSMSPSSGPTVKPTVAPTLAPSSNPTPFPSSKPSMEPSVIPSALPSVSPSAMPSLSPSAMPSDMPSSRPSFAPSVRPTHPPSVSPSASPTFSPSSDPSASPSMKPSFVPTVGPTSTPSRLPTAGPTLAPSSSSPTFAPSLRPSSAAPTSMPSKDPTLAPTTASPTTATPSEGPTSSPTDLLCPLETNEDFVLDTVEFPGEKRNCKWLQKPVGDRLAIYCNDPQSSALQDCPLTCGRCNTEDPACEEEERNATFLRDRDGSQIVDPDETDPELINVRRCKWLVKGQDRIDEFCPRSTSTAADVCPCHCALLDLFIPLFHLP